jgi:predicted nucleic acid-binding protein
MKHIVFDSYALIALFFGEKGSKTVRDLLVQISKEKLSGSIAVVNVGEVFYMISRKSNTVKADKAISAILEFPIAIVNADLNLTLKAASLKARYRLSYADAFAAALSISGEATLITGDTEFNNLKKEKNFSVQFI